MQEHNAEKRAEIQNYINSNDVFLFIKGTAKIPQCGFSSMVVQIFDRLGVKYGHANILADHDLSQELKRFSNWPTFPQVFVKGELIGGCDITKEMYQQGELQDLLKEHNIAYQA